MDTIQGNKWCTQSRQIQRNIPTDRNWMLLCGSGNSTISQETLFDGTVDIWQGKWLRSRCKYCNFLCTCRYSRFKALKRSKHSMLVFNSKKQIILWRALRDKWYTLLDSVSKPAIEPHLEYLPHPLHPLHLQAARRNNINFCSVKLGSRKHP